MTANTPKKPTTVAQWKKGQAEPIQLPSGNYMRIRKISMQGLLAMGKLPNSLMSLVQSAVDKGTGQEAIMDQLGGVMEDPEKLKELVSFMESFVTMVAVDPKVYPAPENESERDPDLLYVDEVDEDDRSYLFQLCAGGVTDLESFRQATTANVDSVLGRENVVVPAVGTAETV